MLIDCMLIDCSLTAIDKAFEILLQDFCNRNDQDDQENDQVDQENDQEL